MILLDNKQIKQIVSYYCKKFNTRNPFETAEYLGVTEEFLNDSLTYYTNKYGVCTQVDNYVIFFQPNIGVMELI